MKFKTIALIAFMPTYLALFTSCVSPTSTTTETESTDSVQISKAIKLEPNNIPKYLVVAGQGVGDNGLQNITMASPPLCASLPTKISDLSSGPQIGDLNSGSEFTVYQFDKSGSANASAMGFTGTIGKKELVFVQDYVRWAEVDCGSEKKRYGIGLRCFIHVKSFRAGLAGSLSMVAAGVELNKATATFNLKSLGFGIPGNVIANGLSTTGKYDVENFAKLALIYNETLKLLSDSSNKTIRPVELPIK